MIEFTCELKPFFPEDNEYPNLAAITTTHLGSEVAGDTGEDAMAIADELKMTTYAYDRIGTGQNTLEHPISLGDYSEYLGIIGKEITKLAIKKHLDGVILLGKSASATEVLGAACGTKAPVLAVGSSDAIGWKQQSRPIALGSYLSYQLEEWLFKDRSKSDKTLANQSRQLAAVSAQESNTPSMRTRQYWDAVTNAFVWSSDISRQHSAHLAEHCPEIAVQVDFMEKTFVVSDRLKDEVGTELTAFRGPDDKPFIVRTLQGTDHSTFNKRSLYVEQAAEIARLGIATA
ncbi:MAG TPA: hypothetical protein VGF75_03995 [Candidatus Saccharimonadales bacterium]|jgi:hypothetical protein